MTDLAHPVIRSSDVDSRAERLLDAAARLVVRWGYRRVTIEDVAREAGVGKGTVYLHFHTKEALFVTVLLREQRAMVTALTEGMRADPMQALPARMLGSAYRRLVEDPLGRAVYLGDVETFGRLAQEAVATLGELGQRRERAALAHLRLLREAGLLRTDVHESAQRYLFSSVATGFFLLDPDMLPSAPADPNARAELLEYAIASVLQVPEARPSPELAEAVAAEYDALIEHIEAEWHRRAR
jgi:AcrR family transcriptional regulator